MPAERLDINNPIYTNLDVANQNAAHSRLSLDYEAEKLYFQPTHRSPERTRSRVNRFIMRVTIGGICLLSAFYRFAPVLGSAHVGSSIRAENATDGVLVDFQVAKPVVFDPPSTKCNEVVLLMDHVFAFSYGQPFVGSFFQDSPDYGPGGLILETNITLL